MTATRNQSATWAVIPSLAPWRGDKRRNPQPYFTAGGISWGSLALAQTAMRALQGRGVNCHLDLIA